MRTFRLPHVSASKYIIPYSTIRVATRTGVCGSEEHMGTIQKEKMSRASVRRWPHCIVQLCAHLLFITYVRILEQSIAVTFPT